MLTPTEVLDPYGPILPEWFDEDSATLEARLQIYLDEGYARAELVYADDQDEAVKRWVEYRVYSRLQRGMAGLSGVRSATLNDQGSFTLSGGEQGGGWARSAQYALQAWRLLTTEREPVRDAADGSILGYTWDEPEEAGS